jgi:CHASE1-domain containing sensor protein
VASAPRRRDVAPEGARRAQRVLTYLALVGVAIGTVGGYLLATADEERSVEREADALIDEAAMSTAAVVSRALDGLQGSQALVDSSGAVDRASFEAFAAGLVGAVREGTALGLVVAGEDRETFEAEEVPITRRRDDGSFAPAPPAEQHLPIVAVISPDPAAQSVVGFDYGSDPVRVEAVRQARDEAARVVSAPTALSPTGEPGFVVLGPLFRRGAAIDTVEQRRRAFVGYLSVTYPATDVLAAIMRELPAGSSLLVRDGEATVLQAGRSPDELAESDFVRTEQIEIPGRTWQIAVRPAEGPARALPLFILIGGTAAELGLITVFVVTWRYQRRLRATFAAMRLSQRRSETLEGLAARLSRSLSSAEVGRALLEQLPPFTGTTAGAVLVLDEDSGDLELLAADGYTTSQLGALERVELREPSAIADVVDSREPAWLPSPLAWRNDTVTGAFGQAGRAAAIVPLVADRRVVGVMILVHPGVRGFYEDERTLLTTVAALAARALNRARRYDAEHDAAVVLQRALLPTVLPQLPDVSAAVRYLPATGELAVGGDWYDLFALGDGRVGVVVGDVVGRGVKAAAAMGRLRSAMRALAQVVPEPAALLEAFEVHVPTIPDALCATMIYAVVDPAAGRLTYVRAGHPPPLLLRRDGRAELLEGSVSPPLGVTGGAPATAVSLSLEPGDVLVLYTDGVVERRGEAVTVGLERLRAVCARAAGLDPDACCDLIVADLLGGEGHGDDAAVVAVRLEPVPDSGETPESAPTTTAV